MRVSRLVLCGLAAALVWAAAPRQAEAAAVPPSAAVALQREAPSAIESVRHRGYYHSPRRYGWGPRWGWRHHYRRHYVRPRVTCRIEYGYYGPRRVCHRRW